MNRTGSERTSQRSVQSITRIRREDGPPADLPGRGRPPGPTGPTGLATARKYFQLLFIFLVIRNKKLQRIPLHELT